MLRIARVTSAVYPDVIGGHAIHCWELSKLQAKGGHDVNVITCKRNGFAEHERMWGYEVFRLPRVVMPWDTLGLENPVLPTLGDSIVQIRPDIVDAQSHLFWTTFTSVRAATKMGIPVITTVHGIIAERGPIINAAQWGYIYTFGSWALRHSTVVVCLSRAGMREVENLGVPYERIRVIPLGVSTEVFHPSSRKAEPFVLWAGRFVHEKGLDDLVLAAGLVKQVRPDLKFILIGDGPERPWLINKIHRLRLSDTVVTIGSQRQEFVADQLRKCLCLVLPSIREGSPRIILEAMSSGTPIIASDLPSISEMATGAAMLIEPSSPDALSKAILLLSQNDSLRVRLGDAGIEHVRTKYSWERVLPLLDEVYNQVLEQ